MNLLFTFKVFDFFVAKNYYIDNFSVFYKVCWHKLDSVPISSVSDN